MTMMTREDVLRELELLPVWQLRAPMPVQAVVAEDTVALEVLDAEIQSDVEPMSVPASNDQEVTIATAPTVQVITSELVNAPEFAYMASEDGSWLFVLGNASPTADELHLLQNIAIALRIKLQALQIASNMSIETQAKRVVVLGELTAQYLLSSQSLLEDLRGIVHTWQGVPLEVTYELAHLLEVQTDKANAWQDLCLAIATV
jgi:DNA polymerase